MAYPNSSLPSDVQDAPYGGQPANKFGTLARQFLDSAIQAIESIILSHIRVPWSTIVVASTTGNNVGDFCLFDQGTFVTGSGYYARNKVGTGSGTFMVFGIFLDAASAGAKARIAYGGLVPPSITGLGVLAADTPITMDLTSGRARAAANGEPVYGYTDIQGQVLLLPPARIA